MQAWILWPDVCQLLPHSLSGLAYTGRPSQPNSMLEITDLSTLCLLSNLNILFIDCASKSWGDQVRDLQAISSWLFLQETPCPVEDRKPFPSLSVSFKLSQINCHPQAVHHREDNRSPANLNSVHLPMTLPKSPFPGFTLHQERMSKLIASGKRLCPIPIKTSNYCRALSNVADEGLLTAGFFWIPSLAGPTSLAAQKAVSHSELPSSF